MSDKPFGLSRRYLLGAAAVTVVSACSGPQRERGERAPSGRSPAARGPGEFRESPMLAARVKAGELPPVKERLPKKPVVMGPGMVIDERLVKLEPGRYGGTLELPMDPVFNSAVYLGNIEPLVWAPNWVDVSKGLQGNLVEGLEVNDKNTTFTFHLREGLRWSDGEPVTIEDVRFTFEDVLLNEEITPVVPGFLRTLSRPGAPAAKLAIVDDLTFSLTFDRPYGRFGSEIAFTGWGSYTDMLKPQHFLKQFHKKYASAKSLQALLKQESIPEDQWFNLFNAKQGELGNFKGPTLTPWIVKQQTTDIFTYERNPYYLKVDGDGNQLPYIDTVRSYAVEDAQTLISRAMFGEFDYTVEWMSLQTMPLVAEKVEKGEVKLLVSRMHRTNGSFALNLTHPDKTWRAVVRDVRFRQALNLAINRREIIEEFYLGEFAQLPKETNSAEYDPELANQLLDQIGLNRRDGSGFRLGPDGKRFVVPIEAYAMSEDHVPMSELIAEYWKGVGVFTSVRVISGSLWSERLSTNELKASSNNVHHDMWPIFIPDYLAGWWAPLWDEWYTSGGKSGEEPPSEVKQLYQEHEKFMASPRGSSESDRAYAAITKNYFDNAWIFNPVEHLYYPCFWTSRVKNVPEGIKKEVFGLSVNLTMEQWYLEG